VLDELVESYVVWRKESAAVQQAYAWWREAWPGEGSQPFDGYRAALDREEQAARVHAELVGCPTRLRSRGRDFVGGQL
jgi:hypothetical protein